jgi:peptidoglycan-associated lipoprotein
MTRTREVLLIAIAVSAAGVLSACKAKPPKTAAEARDTAVQTPGPPAEAAVAAPAPSLQPDVLSGDIADLNRRGYLKNAFFDYDKADLRDDARAALAADARWLKSYPSTQILVEGHCDERGTEEYNFALGDRRASVARRRPFPGEDGLLRQGAAPLFGRERNVLAGEPPGSPRHHGEVNPLNKSRAGADAVVG